MSKLGSLARRLLHRAGYLALRPPHGVSEELPTYLRGIERETSGPLHVVCVDDDTGVQSQLLREFSVEKVWFCSPLELHRQPSPPPPPPHGTQVLILGLFPRPADSSAVTALWTRTWSAILLRVQLGSCWRGEMDLTPWLEQLEQRGFTLEDVVSPPPLSPVQGAAHSVLLAARPRESRRASARATLGLARAAEAATFLTPPVIPSASARILTGRGSGGFRAGLFNPGAIVENGQIELLARGEDTFWRQQQADEPTYFNAVQPCGLKWDPAAGLSPPRPFSWKTPPRLTNWRAEDFRLFRYRDEVYSNHSLLSRCGAPAVTGRPVDLERVRCRVAFSRVDFRSLHLAFQGYPELDVPNRLIEKNWAVMTHGDRLFLSYSAEPFHLLELEDWDRLRFRTVTRTDPRFPFSCPGTTLRNSLNPIDYDERHWLHVVHRVYPGKQYCFWALLIDKARRRPAFALARPLARGGEPLPASILYLCSAIATGEVVRFFFGVNDAGLGVAEVPRPLLDSHWQRLAA
jgi:hypothetical protein